MLTAARILLTLPGQAQGSPYTYDYPPHPAWNGPPGHAYYGGQPTFTIHGGPDAQFLTHIPFCKTVATSHYKVPTL